MTEATKGEAAGLGATYPRIDPASVPGWGVDADPRNDPTYPMRDRQQGETAGMTWTRPTQQEPQVEVLRSIEHNRLPAALGTSTPPRGLSGAIRRCAFRYSESQWAHWLLLIGADRVNVVEGIFGDFKRGRVPNPFAEMGLGAELKHNRKDFLVQTTVLCFALGLGVGVAAGLSER